MPRCLKLYGHLLPACDRTWTPSELSTQIMPPGSQMYSPKPWAVRFRSVFYPSPPLPTSTNGLVKTAPTRSRQFQSEWVLDCSLAPFDFNNATTRSHPHPVARFKAVAPLGPAYCTSAPHSSSNCTSSGSSRKGANSSGLSPPDILAPASLESAFNNSATRSVRPAPYLRPDQTRPSNSGTRHRPHVCTGRSSWKTPVDLPLAPVSPGVLNHYTRCGGLLHLKDAEPQKAYTQK